MKGKNVNMLLKTSIYHFIIAAIPIHKRLVLDKRENSDNWYARLSLADGGNIRRSTKTANLELAKEIALKLFFNEIVCQFFYFHDTFSVPNLIPKLDCTDNIIFVNPAR